MGTGEENTPAKSPKAASSLQETSSIPSTLAYPDWSSSVQALYGGAPPFFASTVASPAPHPYLWGGQHPLMAPYGTPVPYPALYPPGGVYAHPSMTMTQGAVHGTTELDAKGTEGREQASSKKSKGASGSHGGKSGDGGHAPSGSGNDVGTQSAESGSGSGSESSSNGSDDNNNQEYAAVKKGSFDQMLADGANAQNNGVPTNFQTAMPGSGVGPVPATNLNIGTDLWNASPGGGMKMHPNPSGVAAAVAPSGMMNDRWVQDEREMKRQKRKQSNRESARRSRLRKQAECEELQHKVEALTNENQTLSEELQRLLEECEKLTSENDTIKEELTRLCGPNILSRLEENSSSDSRGNEGNS